MRRILPVITAVLLGMVACSANSSGSFLLLSVNNWKAIQTDVSSNHLDPKKNLVVLLIRLCDPHTSGMAKP